MISRIVPVCFAALLGLAPGVQALDGLQAAIDGPQRSAENKARDKYRHPRETLEFFEVKNAMTVVEISPGKGWYTEILAPYLKKHGKLFAAHFSADSSVPFFRRSLAAFKEKMAAEPEIYDAVQLTTLQAPQYTAIAPPGSADRVLTFRNVHNWMSNGQAQTVFAAMYQALKPGGVLGVVEHRQRDTKKQDPRAVSGYVREDFVVGLAEQAGFKLLGKSEINANPRDNGQHPKGVWTLPPTLRLGDADRDKYSGIGESDRMTLKFIKPQH